VGSAAGRRWRPRGMSSTEIAAMTAPAALMRKAILKPAFSGRPLPRTCVAMMVPATCAPRDEPSRAPRKDAARNRSRLIEAAARVFREEGLGVSVNAIADHAGVNVATLYRHFPSKDHLIIAVLEAVLEPLLTARDRALTMLAGVAAAPELSPDRVRRYIDLVLHGLRPD
jgi:hypothetical protein